MSAVEIVKQDETVPQFTAVRAAREEIDAGGLSIAAAAREIGEGVSQATLSRWLRGVYSGDLAAVEERVLTWIDTRREAARRDMAAAGLDRHAPLGVTEEIGDVLSHAQAAGEIVLIHGRSGAGKTWAASRYCGQRSAAYRLAVTGATTTLAGLLSRVSATIGAGGRHPSALEAETAIVSALEGRGALLAVDEAHHLGARLIDELRCLRDLSGCGLALIGGDDLWTALAGNPRLAQVTGRIAIRLPLGAAPRADALALAGGVLGRRPGKNEADALIRAARGAGGLHALRRLLAKSWLLARAEGRERIESPDIAAAAEEAAA